MPRLLLLVVLALVAWPASAQVQIDIAFPNLTFQRVTGLENAGDGSNRLFVAEQPGRIRVFENDADASSAGIFLNIQNRVDSSGNEMGLLGLAFHPEYADNGRFFVNYTVGSPRRTRVSEFSVSASDPNLADASSEIILMEFGQPFSNHNGGDIAFGPDGYLYISSGDGGSGGDPQNNAQNLGNLLGAILRIDVDGNGTPADCGAVGNYTVPANALADGPGGTCDEIYAYGIRNTWRFSFDALTGDFWGADVGQSAWEEINIHQDGGNFGWRIKEGFVCYPIGSTCNDEGLIDPVFAYPHSQGNASITGGFVYRGTNVPELVGRYVFADYVSGRIWALTQRTGSPSSTELFNLPTLLSTFGVDEQNELYVAGFDGRLRVFSSKSVSTETDAEAPASLSLAGPNPFTSRTAFAFTLPEGGPARLAAYDALGREVAVLFDGQVAPAQAQHVAWESAGLAAGVYVIRLVTPTGSEALRVAHVR